MTPSKPTICVATLGADAHGKTALTNALVSVMAARSPGGAQGDRGPSVVEPGCARWMQVFGTDCLGYESAMRRYVHLDCGSGARFAGVLPAILAAVRPDAALVVVSAFEGVTEGTLVQLRAARAAGVRAVLGYVSHADRTEAGAAPDVAEQDLREALADHGFDGDAAVMVAGASHEAAAGDPVWTSRVARLVETLDALPLEGAPREGPLAFAAPLRVAFACARCGARVTRAVTAAPVAASVVVDPASERELPAAEAGTVRLNTRNLGYAAQPGDLCFDPQDTRELLVDMSGWAWQWQGWWEFGCAGTDVIARGWPVNSALAVVVIPRSEVVPLAALSEGGGR